jgi:hypothetical protein
MPPQVDSQNVEKQQPMTEHAYELSDPELRQKSPVE